jgi:hypothetical protein
MSITKLAARMKVGLMIVVVILGVSVVGGGRSMESAKDELHQIWDHRSWLLAAP